MDNFHSMIHAMYERIFQSFLNAGNDNAAPTRRRFPRRANDICVLTIGEHTYPVHDWSQCGVLFEADGRKFITGTETQATLKFRDNDMVIDIPISASVVRSGKNRVAFEFKNITPEIETAFDNIIENATKYAVSTEIN